MSHDEENRNQRAKDGRCRLCLEQKENDQRGMIDLLRYPIVGNIVREVYGVQVRSGDAYTTAICMACHRTLMANYHVHIDNMCKKKCFRINQFVLLGQKNQSRISTGIAPLSGLAKEPAAPATFSSIGIQTEEQNPAPRSRTASRTVPVPVENGETADIRTVSNVTNERNERPINGMESLPVLRLKYFVPVLTDCMKSALYLEALQPLEVSTSEDDAKPLVYLCPNCYSTFDTEQAQDNHRSGNCVRRCRYCQSIREEEHRCEFETKYSSIMSEIVGNGRYRTTATTTVVTEAPQRVETTMEQGEGSKSAKKSKQQPKNTIQNGSPESRNETDSDSEGTPPLVMRLSSSENDSINESVFNWRQRRARTKLTQKKKKRISTKP